MEAHFARRITRYIARYFAWWFAREDVRTQIFLHLEILAVNDEGGDVKRNYLILGFALLGMSMAVLAQDPAAKPAPKKAAATKGSPTKGKEVFDQKCGVCHFADSDAKKIGPGLKGISKRGTFTVNNNKVTDDNLKTWIENGDSLMPPFKDVLDEQQIKDVIAYVKTL
jgi:mono/diheme cytochrome c family protein